MSLEPYSHPAVDAAVAERLERGARLAQVLSRELCRTKIGNDECGALHGIWPLLRRLGLAAEPARHAEFYGAVLGQLAVSGSAGRVLVAGSADWGMLELIADVYRRHRAPLDVTVVDRCATPVLLNAWFGSETGLAVRTGTADLLQYVDGEPFDVICTHSLLGYPSPAGRVELVGNWRRLLRPGGVVVTVSRLSTATPLVDRDAPESHRRASAFADEVLARYRRLPIDGDPGDLRSRAERFSLAQVHNPVGDADALRGLFELQGFDVTALDLRTIEAATGTVQAVVGAARSGVYGEIVAVKR